MFDILTMQLQHLVRSIQWKQDEDSKRIDTLQKHVEELYRRFDDLMGNGTETVTTTSTMPIDPSEKPISPLPEMVKEKLGIGLHEIDFSDHKTLNYFFKEFCPITNYDKDEFMIFIEGLEKASGICSEFGDVSVLDVLRLIGYSIENFSDEMKEELAIYRWHDDSNCFDYQLNVYHPDELGNVEYYVVFSSAPSFDEDDD